MPRILWGGGGGEGEEHLPPPPAQILKETLYAM